MSIFGAYLEDYHYIKVIIPKTYSLKQIILKADEEDIPLSIFKDETYYSERHLHTSFGGYICLQKDYRIICEDDEFNTLEYPLSLGKITRTKRFDIENYTDENLGVIYSPLSTTFKVWSPVSKEMYLVLNGEELPMTYTSKGVWRLQVDGDLEGALYHFKLRVNNTFNECLDPYAKASTPNFTDNIVIDLQKTYQMEYGRVSSIDPIIEEISIRDLTIQKDNGTFKAATRSIDQDYGLGYLSNIGFTHIQLMPVYGFGGVDEITKENYNWGYNPVSYQSISNYLTEDFNNPYAGINELKEMIDKLHHNFLGVTMDVVFNHVYDVNTFPFSILVPGYAYQIDNRGFLTNFSGCGNDLNSTKLMVRRFIVDTTLYYYNEFKLDGFRFDIMSLIDVDTLNIIREKINSINSNCLLYGEGWKMPSALPLDMSGRMDNFYELPNYSFFNDEFRNLFRCNFDTTYGGFTMGTQYPHKYLFNAITAYCINEEMFNKPQSSLNFVECHDGYTLYDAFYKLNPKMSKEEYKERLLLALGLVCLSQGTPFYHLGLEFGRSKQGIENSYNSPDEINMVDWDKVNEYKNVILGFKDLLELRKKYSFFRFKDANDIKNYVSLETRKDSLQIRYRDKKNNNDYVLIIKNNTSSEKRYFSPGTVCLFDGSKQSNDVVETITISRPGIYFYKK